jgi:DNA-directed RNA polymerase subunit B
MMFGYAASLVPMPERIPAARIGFQAGMNKQKLEILSVADRYRFSSNKVLLAGREPRFYTEMNKRIGTLNKGGGVELLLAIMPFKGNNQEDAIVFNKKTNDRGFFSHIKYHSIQTIILLPCEHLNVTAGDILLLQTYPYRNLNTAKTSNAVLANCEKSISGEIIITDMKKPNTDNFIPGIIRVGSEVEIGDILVKKGIFIKDKDGNSKQERDTSIKAGPDDVGIVDMVEYVRNTINIKIRKFDAGITPGDKLAIRYSQKGTAAALENNMPIVESGQYKGREIDVIINPHAIPSRMTVSLLFEMLTNKSGALEGKNVDATAFKDFNIGEFMKTLEANQMDEFGLESLSRPINGKKVIYPNKINVGPIYYTILPHLVKDKIQFRSTGAVDRITRQPEAGKNRGGGIRLGEMEFWSLVSHGALNVLKERTVLTSDRYDAAFCNECKEIAEGKIVDGNVKFICRTGCDAKTGRMTIPYSFKRFMDMMKVVGVNFNPVFTTTKPAKNTLPNYSENVNDAESDTDADNDDADDAEGDNDDDDV